MDVAVAVVQPVAEFDAELEGAVGAADELGLVEAEPVDPIVELGDGRLADPNGSDLVGFDQGDRSDIPQEGREDRRGQPPGRSAAGNDDVVRRALDHRRIGTRTRQRKCTAGSRVSVNCRGQAPEQAAVAAGA